MSYDHEKVHRLLELSRRLGDNGSAPDRHLLQALDAKLDAILEIVTDGEPIIIVKRHADG